MGLDLFGLITGAADFAASKTEVDVDLGAEQLDNAGLLTFALSNLTAGVGGGGFGFAVRGGTIGIAVLTAPVGTRSWVAVSARDIEIELSVPGVTARVTNAGLLINQASGGATALDWTTSVDTDPAGGFDGADPVDPGRVAADTGRPDDHAPQRAARGLRPARQPRPLRRDRRQRRLRRRPPEGRRRPRRRRSQLDDASLLTFALSNLNLAVGSDGFGLVISSGNIGIAALAAPVGDGRRWTTISASNLVDHADRPRHHRGRDRGPDRHQPGQRRVRPDARQPDLGDEVVAVALDWTTSVDMDPAGGFDGADPVNPGAILNPAVDLTMTERAARLGVAGKLVEPQHLRLRHRRGDASRSTSARSASSSPADAPAGASLLTFGITNLNLTLGDPNGVNFAITGGSLVLAAAKATPPTAPATDTRSWTAIRGAIELATVNGLGPDIRFELRSLSIDINTAAGQASPAVLATALDWTTAIDLDGDGTFGDEVSAAGQVIDLAGQLLRASGRVDINLFDLVAGTVAFAFEQRTIGVQLAGGNLTGAKLTTFGLDVLPDDGDASNGVEQGLFIGVPGSVGFQLGLRLAAAGDDQARADDRHAQLERGRRPRSPAARFTGLGDDFKAEVVSLGVEINRASVGTAALNWTTAIDLDNDGTFGDDIGIAYTEETFGASGRFIVDIFGFVTGDVGFRFETSKVGVDLGGPRIAGATLTRISLTVNSLFVGVPNGPGFRVTAGKLAVATIKPAPTGTTPDPRSWMAISATLGSAALEGLDGIVLAMTDGALTINRGTGASPLNWATAIDVGNNGSFGDPVAVRHQDGTETPITVSGNRLEVSGTATVNLFDFVRGSVRFEFGFRDVDVDLDANGTRDLDNAQPDDDLPRAPAAAVHRRRRHRLHGRHRHRRGRRAEAGRRGRRARRPAQLDAISTRFGNAGFSGIDALDLNARIDRARHQPVRRRRRPAEGAGLDEGAALRRQRRVRRRADARHGHDRPHDAAAAGLGRADAADRRLRLRQRRLRAREGRQPVRHARGRDDDDRGHRAADRHLQRLRVRRHRLARRQRRRRLRRRRRPHAVDRGRRRADQRHARPGADEGGRSGPEALVHRAQGQRLGAR